MFGKKKVITASLDKNKSIWLDKSTNKSHSIEDSKFIYYAKTDEFISKLEIYIKPNKYINLLNCYIKY